MAVYNKIRENTWILILMIFISWSSFAQVIDADKDGVSDEKDLCPNTPLGTNVNEYGCPIDLSSCDYLTNSFTMNLVGVAPVDTRYLLVNSSTGIIEQVSTTPTFSGLVGTKTYMALAYSYTGNPNGLNVNSLLSSVASNCQDFSNALMVKVCAPLSDADKDGVSDEKDLCPNTPLGTNVNEYGCPIDLSSCDYQTSNITFNTGTLPIGKQTRYILATSSDGKIVQVSTTPTFTGLVGSKTYMVLTFSYEDDGSLVNLSPNNFIKNVASTCFDWSNALVVKVCVPFIPGNNCDFATSTITLNTLGVVPSNATTKYVLVNTQGIISKISDSPSFSGLSGVNSYNVFSISYSGAINNLIIGNNFSTVSGDCFDWSNPLPIKVCVCKPICLPVVITKTK